MFYSINIGAYKSAGYYNTWTDFHLFPTSRPLVNPPEVRFKTVEIPGMNGVLDLTDALSDGTEPAYGTRKGSWEFIVVNNNISISGLQDYVEAGRNFHNRRWITELEKDIPGDDEHVTTWFMIYTLLMQRLHGYRLVVSLTDDPDYSYFGRMSVNEWKSDKEYSIVTLDYEFQPFRFLNTIDLDPEKASILRSEGGVL